MCLLRKGGKAINKIVGGERVFIIWKKEVIHIQDVIRRGKEDHVTFLRKGGERGKSHLTNGSQPYGDNSHPKNTPWEKDESELLVKGKKKSFLVGRLSWEGGRGH